MYKDITNPAVIKFLYNMYEKEGNIRIQWVNKHRDKIMLAATLNREPTNYYEKDVDIYKMKEGLTTITRDHISGGYNKRKTPIRDARSLPDTKCLLHGHSIVDIGIGDPKEDPRLVRPDTDLSIDPIMRPVEPKIQKILYKERPTFGRELYLKTRTKEMPEKRYYFPECNSWNYGWRIADSGLKLDRKYGRRWHLSRELHNRVGPQPDPEHYAPVARGGNTL